MHFLILLKNLLGFLKMLKTSSTPLESLRYKSSKNRKYRYKSRYLKKSFNAPTCRLVSICVAEITSILLFAALPGTFLVYLYPFILVMTTLKALPNQDYLLLCRQVFVFLLFFQISSLIFFLTSTFYGAFLHGLVYLQPFDYFCLARRHSQVYRIVKV